VLWLNRAGAKEGRRKGKGKEIGLGAVVVVGVTARAEVEKKGSSELLLGRRLGVGGGSQQALKGVRVQFGNVVTADCRLSGKEEKWKRESKSEREWE